MTMASWFSSAVSLLGSTSIRCAVEMCRRGNQTKYGSVSTYTTLMVAYWSYYIMLKFKQVAEGGAAAEAL